MPIGSNGNEIRMTKEIDYYISLNSPWTYLGSRRLEEIARTHRAEVRVKPVDFATIFPSTGGLPLAKRTPERQAYRLVELARWREVRDLPLNLACELPWCGAGCRSVGRPRHGR